MTLANLHFKILPNTLILRCYRDLKDLRLLSKTMHMLLIFAKFLMMKFNYEIIKLL